MPQTRYGVQNQVVEWSYISGKVYSDPFNDVDVDVVFSDSKCMNWKVPAFWAGDNEWRVRFAAPYPGIYKYITFCSDEINSDLHGQEGILKVSPYIGNNELLRHGNVKVSRDRKHFEHEDGKPFFWLGDTWWMAFCTRLEYPGEFRLLTADRKDKGFTVVHIVAGLYPDMPWLDTRGMNEAGFPWTEGFERINPAYFDMADLRIQHLVSSGIVPCIFGCWGFYYLLMGTNRMKKHWRHLIARYGAYPVIWSLAGEGTMPYYLSENIDEDRAALKKGMTELGYFLRENDPYRHPVTVHSPHYCTSGDQVENSEVLDFEMPQPGHGSYTHMSDAAKLISELVRKSAEQPVVNGETFYEGIFSSCFSDIQRFVFWSSMLSGAAGFTYGASGLWQFNRKEKPFGSSPNGVSWGDTTWEEAYRYEGSRHIGIGKRLLERYEWYKFEAHQEWVEPAAGKGNYTDPFAAGIPGKVRVFYFFGPVHPFSPKINIKELEQDVNYKAFYFDPANGNEYFCGKVEAGSDGNWKPPLPPVAHDWVLVMEAV